MTPSPLPIPLLLPADDDRNWFSTLVQVRGSVVPKVLPRVAVCAGFAALVVLAGQWGWSAGQPPLSSFIPSIVLGLLLVFRTNTAYDRFWEGRKLWGNITNESRNLARQLWLSVGESFPGDRAEKIAVLREIEAFAYAMKDHLRQEPLAEKTLDLVSPEAAQQLRDGQHVPLILAFRIEDYLQRQMERGTLDRYRLGSLNESLDVLVVSLGGCERILRTPMPFAYSIHLRQLLMIYCLALPLELAGKFGPWSIVLVTLISFALLGIEEIGEEIENPFGRDANDLPLESICANIERNLEEIISLGSQAKRNL